MGYTAPTRVTVSEVKIYDAIPKGKNATEQIATAQYAAWILQSTPLFGSMRSHSDAAARIANEEDTDIQKLLSSLIGEEEAKGKLGCC